MMVLGYFLPFPTYSLLAKTFLRCLGRGDRDLCPSQATGVLVVACPEVHQVLGHCWGQWGTGVSPVSLIVGWMICDKDWKVSHSGSRSWDHLNEDMWSPYLLGYKSSPTFWRLNLQGFPSDRSVVIIDVGVSEHPRICRALAQDGGQPSRKTSHMLRVLGLSLNARMGQG